MPTHPDDRMGDQAWADVIQAMDRTYAELVQHQERLEAQNAELESMRGFLESVFASVSDILLVVSRSGTVEQVSHSLADRLQQDAGALRGTRAAGLFCDMAGLSAALEDCRSRRAPVTLELELAATPDPMPYELVISPRCDERGRMAGYVLAGRSVGELRHAYQALERSHHELKAMQGQMVRNEKLASLGRLLAGVAHELNNPISFVYANAHALERYATKFETYFDRVTAGASRADLIALREELRLDRDLRNMREAIHGARDGAERVRDIVADLRRLSAGGDGEMTSFDLVEVARVAADWVKRGRAGGVTLRREGCESLMVTGRAGHIQQVVMNLVQNALDVLDGQPDAALCLRHFTQGDVAVLEVSDNGPGIAPDVQATIFDPFFTTKPVGQGTGLGLSISHKIAEEHGGNLRLCPEQAGGACFRLELPLSQAPGAS
ncbi:MAG: PAS domain-containing protein [Alphaproteobacteria bacterium]|jgi:two-component system sensor histidine kinase HupT/HoxJ|nr:PAS domain-containing protein [Alphaproteobacteria bacterium]